VSVITIFLNAEAFIEEAINRRTIDGNCCSSMTDRRPGAYATNNPEKVRYFEHEGHCDRSLRGMEVEPQRPRSLSDHGLGGYIRGCIAEVEQAR
jgi:hypothetical protein